jgi:hypothetical protein
MSHASSGLSIVSAPLPIVDRRALSQAWYSALHLTPRDRGRSARLSVPSAPAESLARSRSHGDAATARGDAGAPREKPAKAGMRERTALTFERRSPPAPLARKVIRAVERRLPARMPASVALRAASGRVHVVVRRDGQTLRLIALCTPALREAVERALAQARYALAARGTRTC